jgi:MEDS: MEthanogen/methylotroph, DcmR Sensory domain
VPSPDVFIAPSTGHHIVQLYPEPDFPVRAVGEFVGEGLSRGEAVVVIATAPHWQALERQLAEQRFDVETRVRQGQLVIRDATSSLPELLVNGELDRGRFQIVSGSAIAAAERFGYARLRVFGEMVDLLRRTDLAAAIRLEALWTEILTVKRIAMLCTYALDVFEPAVYRGVLQSVCGAHTHLLPIEDRGRFDRAVARAYADVFGGPGEAETRQRQFLESYVRPAAMPDGEAAILAACELAPAATSTALLERARHHYRAG